MLRWSSLALFRGPRPAAAALIGSLIPALLTGLLSCSGCHDGAPAPSTVTPSSAPSTRPSSASSGEPADAAPASESPADAPSGDKTATPDASNETIVHADDDGRSFQVARGSTVTFALRNHAGTGYVWVATHVDANVLAQQGDRTSDLSSDVPGAPKADVFHFAAHCASIGASCTTSVEMTLTRPFGAGTPARVVHVTVTVR
ncbi:MAG TPA: protease inhibitor I42 family protein [Polyangiaceae bacterium]|nr:protease inhibitor I42 family protein [Polyangiaceae bacterium]